MGKTPVTLPVTLRLPAEMMARLQAHLFRGDDEHGAVIGALVLKTSRGVRLIGRKLFLANDGTDYIRNDKASWTLVPTFVRRCVSICEKEGLAYLAVHNHPGKDRVGFSEIDLASHRHSYPALLDILDGPPAGGLVFANQAVAGDIWFSKKSQVALDHAHVIGVSQVVLHPSPPSRPNSGFSYDRQVRIFGDRGQDILAKQKVVIIGVGGAGSIINEYLARLGVGNIVAIDYDRLEASNFPRIVGARRKDLRCGVFWNCLSRLQRRGEQQGVLKVRIAERVAHEANSDIRFEKIIGDIYDDTVKQHCIDSDAIFLAADTMKARDAVNQICHKYLIPVWQVGAKVQPDIDGNITDVFSVVRQLVPRESCLRCNGLIFSDRLAVEASTQETRDASRYVEDVVNPSVITLNAVSAAHAVNEYLFSTTCPELYEKSTSTGAISASHGVRWIKYHATIPRPTVMRPSQAQTCWHCDGG